MLSNLRIVVLTKILSDLGIVVSNPNSLFHQLSKVSCRLVAQCLRSKITARSKPKEDDLVDFEEVEDADATDVSAGKIDARNVAQNSQTLSVNQRTCNLLSPKWRKKDRAQGKKESDFRAKIKDSSLET